MSADSARAGSSFLLLAMPAGRADLTLATSKRPPDLPGGCPTWRLASELWEPYLIGDFAYDPLESVEAAIGRGRAAAERERDNPDPVPREAAWALWSAIELDLTRFARDSFVRRNLSEARSAAPESDDARDERRFARLNDLYRAVYLAILPRGVAPRRWRLRLEDRSLPRTNPAAERLGARFLGMATDPEALAVRVALACGANGCAVSRESAAGDGSAADGD